MIDKATRKRLEEVWDNSYHDYRIQIYGIITPRANGEFRLNCYAVSETKRYKVQMVECNRAWSDRPYYQCKNIWRGFWGATRVVFDEKRDKPSQEDSWYNDNWGKRVFWNDDESWFMKYVKYINLDALDQTRYRYCGFRAYKGTLSLIQYLRVWDNHKEVELLSKAGMSQFVNPWFLKRMAKNDRLRAFFRNNGKEIAKTPFRYTTADVSRAFSKGWSLEQSYRWRQMSYRFRKVPKGVDWEKLARYLTEKDIDDSEYLAYCKDVEQAKLDILGFGMTFPKNFHRKRSAVARIVQAEQNKKDAPRIEALKAIASRLNLLLERMHKRLENRVGNFDVVFPTTRYDFESEGARMHNCMGIYFTKCADGDTFCYFINKNGKRLADVEMSPKSGKVLQCRLKYNKNSDEETMAFATEMSKKFARAMRKAG